ncbi:hypothetical protein U9M48_023007 [Paspalum notatum var. saurae]|uniref:Uncharacterized protein n=1 Tax=Paspalum notatum var. saurae TaxID=547442 RepID=A0AAQ3WVH6_PASNO
MRRGGGGGRLPKSSLAPSTAARSRHHPHSGVWIPLQRHPQPQLGLRDSDPASHCSSCPASSARASPKCPMRSLLAPPMPPTISCVTPPRATSYHYLSGTRRADDAVDAHDEEYFFKAWTDGEAAVATNSALEKDQRHWRWRRMHLLCGEDLETRSIKGKMRWWIWRKSWRQKCWKDTQCIAAGNHDLLKKVDARAVNARDVDVDD